MGAEITAIQLAPYFTCFSESGEEAGGVPAVGCDEGGGKEGRDRRRTTRRKGVEEEGNVRGLGGAGKELLGTTPPSLPYSPRRVGRLPSTAARSLG